MDAWKIKKMVDVLDTAGLITGKSKKEKTIKAIENFFEDTIHIEWCVEDIIDRAKDNDINISEEQARKVLEDVRRYHDCETGVNWDVIDYHIENLTIGAEK